MKQLRLFLGFYLPFILAAQNNNPIIETNNLVVKMDAQFKSKAFKETIQLSWKPDEIGTEDPISVVPKITFRYLAMADGTGMQIIQFSGYESESNLTYYCKGNAPFYAILSNSTEGCTNRYKVYYDRMEPIKCLRQTNDCTGGALGSVEELKDEVAISEELMSFDDFLAMAETRVSQYIKGLEENAEVYPLRKEIKDIQSYAQLLAFVQRHSPSFADLDSLYTLLTNKPCPPGLTNSIVNGDPSIQQTVPKDYLHFVFRNSTQQFDYNIQSDKDIERITTFQDFQTNMANFQDKVAIETAANFSRSYSNFNLEQLVYVPSTEMLTVGSNFKSWYPKMVRNRVTYYPSIYAMSSKVTMYDIQEEFDFTEYDDALENAKEQEKEAFKSKFATDTYSKNLYRYVQSQVFNDLVFIYINNRWVFFDIDR